VRRSRFVAWSIASALTVSAYVGVLPAAVTAAHADEYHPDSLRGTPLTPRPERTAPSQTDDPSLASPAATAPAPGEADVDVPATGMARAGSLPILVGRAASGSPGRVRVQLLDQRQAAAFGAQFVAFRVSRADGSRASANVKVAVDYGGFARAYGGDFATRLHLVRIPACVNSPRCPSTPIPTARNSLTKQLSVETATEPDPGAPTADAESVSYGAPVLYEESATTVMPDSGSMTTMAVDSGTSGEVSDYSATPFQQSQKWQVGVGSGNFSYTYDIPLPPAVAGPVPRIALDYSSQSVDGRTASQNSQPSQIGEGWSFEPGYIERRFVPCAQDGLPDKGDNCWNATPEHFLHLNGMTSELVRPTTGGNEWRLRDDPAWRVQNFSMPVSEPNGDVNRTYWVVTTPDGTKYQFGTGREPTTGILTNSAWTVPVFGNNSGEACYNAVSSLASCDAAWRFNLDYVKDVNGNAATLFWAKETNKYQRYGTTPASYTRAGYLTRVEYSQRAGSEGATAPSVVIPATANRCTVSGCGDVGSAGWVQAQYPDVPGDLVCTSSTSCPKDSPSFFTGKKITQFETWVWNGLNYRSVTQVDLTHTFPATGESDVSPVLWLNTITRVGSLTTPDHPDPVALPQVTLYGDKLPNRVDNNPGAGVPATYKYRVIAIRDEIGGEVEVDYGQPHPCSPIPVTWDTNTKDCFAQWFTPTGGSGGYGAFNKYLVTAMRQIDDTGISPTVTTNYTYLGLPAWHYDDSLVGGPSQTWSDWRGYEITQTQTPGPAGLLSTTRHLVFRGMNGDKLVGGTRSITTTADSEQASFTDSNWLAGRTIEVSHYSTGGSVLAAEVSRYWAQNTVMGPSNFQQHNAQYVRQSTTLTKYADTSTPADDWVERRVDTTFDDTYSYPTQTFDWGNTAGALGDETCIRYATTPNTSAWLISVTYQTLTYDGTCSNQNAPMIGRHDVYYDGQAFSAVPVKGMPTTVGDSVDGVNRALTRTAYDSFGRVTEVTGPNQYSAPSPKKTVTTYTPTTGYPTNVSVKDPLNHVTNTVLSSAWGGIVSATDANNQTTTVDRDPLGRVVAVTRPGDPSGQNSVKYAYNVSYVSPSWVKHSVLQQMEGTTPRYVDDYTWVDGFGRTVETQSRSPYTTTPGGTPTGRIVTTTRYDIQGNVDAQTQPQYDTGGNGSGYLDVDPASVAVEERYDYDPLGRQIDAQHWASNAMQWHTVTTHYGTHDKIDYPVRNDVRRYTDVFGRLTKVAESLTSGTADTDYTYTARGDLDTITDDLGNVWNYDYDWLGRRLQSKDPDQGTWSTGYDPEGHVTSVTDNKPATVAFKYDDAGRKIGAYVGTVSGTTLATWAYDTAPLGVGRLASSSRVDGGSSYTTAVTGYDGRGRATGKSTTVPAAESPLAGTYAYSYGYDYADHPTTVSFPAAGDLPAETVTTAYEKYTGYALTMNGTSTYVGATTYTGEGRPLTRSVGPTGVGRAYTYGDAAKRLTNITTTNGAATVENNTYVYDAESNVKAIVDRAVPAAVQTECFGYDIRNQLARAFTNAGDETTCGTAAPAGADPYDLTYAVNTIGNITSVTDGVTIKAYTYPTSGPTAVRPHAVTAVGSASYGYDLNGAMTNHAGDTLAWDELHQLRSVTGASSATFAYDADGTRLLRRTGTGPTRTLYLDGMELTAVGSGSVVATRYYGSFAMRTAVGVTALLRNNQGSATVTVSPTGVATRRRYYPYGGQRGATDLTATERGFLDQTEDPTGLIATGARYLDVQTTTFVSPDPLLVPSSPQTLNPYAYALRSPATYVDPNGLEPYRYTDGSWGGFGCADGSCTSSVPQAETSRLQSQANDARVRSVTARVTAVVHTQLEQKRRDPGSYWRNVGGSCNLGIPGNGGSGGACENAWIQSEIANALVQAADTEDRGLLHDLAGCYDGSVGDCFNAWLPFGIAGALIALGGSTGTGALGATAEETAASGTIRQSLAFALRAEKMEHVFVARHNFASLIVQLGSKRAVMTAIIVGAHDVVATEGVFEEMVQVGSEAIVVRGAMIDGVIKLGTAFIR
jgi:RHS repeat-associated protein